MESRQEQKTPAYLGLEKKLNAVGLIAKEITIFNETPEKKDVDFYAISYGIVLMSEVLNPIDRNPVLHHVDDQKNIIPIMKQYDPSFSGEKIDDFKKVIKNLKDRRNILTDHMSRITEEAKLKSFIGDSAIQCFRFSKCLEENNSQSITPDTFAGVDYKSYTTNQLHPSNRLRVIIGLLNRIKELQDAYNKIEKNGEEAKKLKYAISMAYIIVGENSRELAKANNAPETLSDLFQEIHTMRDSTAHLNIHTQRGNPIERNFDKLIQFDPLVCKNKLMDAYQGKFNNFNPINLIAPTPFVADKKKEKTDPRTEFRSKLNEINSLNEQLDKKFNQQFNALHDIYSQIKEKISSQSDYSPLKKKFEDTYQECITEMQESKSEEKQQAAQKVEEKKNTPKSQAPDLKAKEKNALSSIIGDYDSGSDEENKDKNNESDKDEPANEPPEKKQRTGGHSQPSPSSRVSQSASLSSSSSHSSPSAAPSAPSNMPSPSPQGQIQQALRAAADSAVASVNLPATGQNIAKNVSGNIQINKQPSNK